MYNKSIAGFRIFERDVNVQRFLIALDYYRYDTQTSLSSALRNQTYIPQPLVNPNNNMSPVKILAYCMMPTHYHLLLKCEALTEISRYIGIVESSYSHYYNTKIDRPGPLWQSRFKKTTIGSSSELLHVLRYIHLNPTTAELVENPFDWPYSSYKDYLTDPSILKTFSEISIRSIDQFKKFTENNLAYQRRLHMIKKHISK